MNLRNNVQPVNLNFGRRSNNILVYFFPVCQEKQFLPFNSMGTFYLLFRI